MSEYSMPSYFQSMPVIGKDLIKVRGADGSLDTFVRLPEQPFRPSWRQMQ